MATAPLTNYFWFSLSPANAEILVALIQLTKLSNGFTNRQVHFTGYELLKLLGWSDEGRNYDRIEKSPNRWVGVTFFYDTAWWNREAKSVEEMELKQKESATEIARPRDAAEMKRQGALTTGSVWKGKSYRASLVYDATLTVISRDKDEIQVKLLKTQPNLGGSSFMYQGTIQGNTLRLKAAEVSTTDNIEATYHPASQTITGNYTTAAGTDGTFKVQLHKGD